MEISPCGGWRTWYHVSEFEILSKKIYITIVTSCLHKTAILGTAFILRRVLGISEFRKKFRCQVKLSQKVRRKNNGYNNNNNNNDNDNLIISKLLREKFIIFDVTMFY